MVAYAHGIGCAIGKREAVDGEAEQHLRRRGIVGGDAQDAAVCSSRLLFGHVDVQPPWLAEAALQMAMQAGGNRVVLGDSVMK